MKVLVDADLILEALLNRENWAEDAQQLWEMLESRQIQGYITELGVEKIRLYASKFNCVEAEEAISDIQEIILICVVDKIILEKARSSNLIDFDSAVEETCAINENIGAIVTQNPQDFSGTDLAVLSVYELLERYFLAKSFFLEPKASIPTSELTNSISSSAKILSQIQDYLKKIKVEYDSKETEVTDKAHQTLFFSGSYKSDTRIPTLIDSEVLIIDSCATGSGKSVPFLNDSLTKYLKYLSRKFKRFSITFLPSNRYLSSGSSSEYISIEEIPKPVFPLFYGRHKQPPVEFFLARCSDKSYHLIQDKYPNVYEAMKFIIKPDTSRIFKALHPLQETTFSTGIARYNNHNRNHRHRNRHQRNR